MTRSEAVRVVLVEGYDDRAFWRGWLGKLGCREDRAVVTTDPKGTFGFRTSTQECVKVRMCGGVDGLNLAFKNLLARDVAVRNNGPLRVLVNRDSDAKKGGDGAVDSSLTALFARSGLHPETPTGPATGQRHPGARSHWWSDPQRPVRAASVVWRAPDADENGVLPEKRTLERLVCAAVLRAYPAAEEPLRQWRDAEPQQLTRPTQPHRMLAGSIFAKWYTWDAGADVSFYERVWADDAVYDKLRDLLQEHHEWALVEEFLSR